MKIVQKFTQLQSNKTEEDTNYKQQLHMQWNDITNTLTIIANLLCGANSLSPTHSHAHPESQVYHFLPGHPSIYPFTHTPRTKNAHAATQYATFTLNDNIYMG